MYCKSHVLKEVHLCCCRPLHNLQTPVRVLGSFPELHVLCVTALVMWSIICSMWELFVLYLRVCVCVCVWVRVCGGSYTYIKVPLQKQQHHAFPVWCVLRFYKPTQIALMRIVEIKAFCFYDPKSLWPCFVQILRGYIVPGHFHFCCCSFLFFHCSYNANKAQLKCTVAKWLAFNSKRDSTAIYFLCTLRVRVCVCFTVLVGHHHHTLYILSL